MLEFKAKYFKKWEGTETIGREIKPSDIQNVSEVMVKNVRILTQNMQYLANGSFADPC
jgi:hypothetical protein